MKKSILKKVVSILLMLSIVLSMGFMVIPTAAKQISAPKVYQITYASPAIPMFAGTSVDLSEVAVQFSEDGAMINGTDIDWELEPISDKDALVLSGRKLAALKTGRYKIIAKSASKKREIYVFVNNSGDFDFILTEFSFENETRDSIINNPNFILSHAGKFASNHATPFYRTQWPADAWNIHYPSSNRSDLYLKFLSDTHTVYYTAPILSDFADYTFTARVAGGHAYDWASTRGFILRANVNFSEVNETINVITGKNLYFIHKIYGSVSMGSYGNENMVSSAYRGYASDTLHSLEGEDWKKFVNTTDEYKKTDEHPNFDPAGDNAYTLNDNQEDIKDIEIVLDGANVKYTMNSNVLLDTTKTVYKITEPNIKSNAKNQVFDYHNAFDKNGYKGAGNAIGFTMVQGQFSIYSFAAKLNVTSPLDMPSSMQYTVSDHTPVLPLTAGKQIDKDNFLVTIGENVYIASALTWSMSKNDSNIFYTGDYIGAYKKGTYTLIATAPSGEKISVYLVVKNADETEYTIFEDNYRSSLVKEGDSYVKRTNYGNWTSSIYNYESKTTFAATNGNFAANIKEGARIGLLPYDNYNIMTEANMPEGRNYMITSVLDNDIVKNLTNYKYSATVMMDPGGSSSIGIIGRVNDEGDGFTGVTQTCSSVYTQGATKAKSIYQINGYAQPQAVEGDFSNAWFYSWGNSRTIKTNTVKTLSLEFNGNKVEYCLSAVNHQSVKYTVRDENIQKGNVGIVVYGCHYNSHTVAAPTVLEIAVTLVGVENAEKQMKVTDIPNFEKRADDERYYEIADSYVFNVDGSSITNVTANPNATVLGEKVTIPASVDGTKITALGIGSWKYDASVRVFETVKSNVLEVDLSNTQITTIGGGAFYDMPYVEIIRFPETLTTIKASRAFANTGILRELYMPNVTTATWNDFYAAKSLEKIDISSVKKITEDTFSTCMSLVEVKLGNNLTEIGNRSFKGCSALYKIELPSSLATISTNAFESCVSLEDIVIPASVTSIGSKAFVGCSSLKTVYIKNRSVTIGAEAIPTTAVIYGYKGSTAEQYAVDNGIEFKAIETNTVYEISVNSKDELPNNFDGNSVVWKDIRNDNFIVEDNKIIALQKGTNKVYGTLEIEGVTVESELIVKVTDYKNDADNFANDDFGVSLTNSDTLYTLNVLSSGLKPKTLKVNGEGVLLEEVAVQDGIASGREYSLYCEDIFSLSVEGEFQRDENIQKQSIYNLGATVEADSNADGHKLKFVFRTSAIKPAGVTIAEGGKLEDSVQFSDQNVTPTNIGVFMIPEALLTYINIKPTLKEGFNINKNEVRVHNSEFPAANVKIKYLDNMTYDYADFYATLTSIENGMQYVRMVCVPYITYVDASGKDGVIYGEKIIRSHDTANATLHKTEDEILSLYRPETERRIAEIKATTSNIQPTGSGKKIYVSNTDPNACDTYAPYEFAPSYTVNNDGTSQDRPIKTLEYLNGLDIPEGSVVYFKRGDIFRGTVKAQKGVTYTCYGDNSLGKPEVWGSLYNYAEYGSWIETDTPNVYKYSEPQTEDVGMIVFNSGEANGEKIIRALDTTTNKYYNHKTKESFTDYRDLNKNLDFFHDEDNDYVYLYCEGGNPSDLYDVIDFSLRPHTFQVSKNDNVVIDNMIFRYTGGHGVAAGTCTGLTVQNCEFYWIGGGRQGVKGTTTRFGNGVEIWGGAYDFTIDNCYFHQIYDAGLTWQFYNKDEANNEKDRPLSAVNVHFINNVMEYCNYSIEYFLNTPPNEINGIDGFYIENNLMWYAGYGLCSQRPDTTGDCHIKSWEHTNPNVKNYFIRNNLFAMANSYLSETLSMTEETSELPQYWGNTYIQFANRRLGYTGSATTISKYDYEVRNVIYSEFGDTIGTILWVDK